MAKFYRITNTNGSTLNNVWINIDTIVSMWYDAEDDKTCIFSCDDPNEHFTIKGNAINDILNANNELTLKDKNFANYLFNKFKDTLSSIVARLDRISNKKE